MKTNMKTKKIIMEQTTVPEELKKFFLIPGCFDSKTASVEQVTIGGKNAFAIKKESVKNPGTFIYYTSNGNKYSGSPQNLVVMDSKWSCQGNVQTMQASPAVEYFNSLGIDLTKPDQVDFINDAIEILQGVVNNGATGNDIRKFQRFTAELKKDPNYKNYKDTQGREILTLTAAPSGDVANEFQTMFDRPWSLRTPDDNEIDSFTKKQIRIGNGVITYYTWRGAGTTDLVSKQYDSTACTNNIISYYQLVKAGAGLPNKEKLQNLKNNIIKCYTRFWYDNVLNDVDETGKIKLKLSRKDKEQVQKLLIKLMNERGQTGVGIGTPAPATPSVQFESLEKRLRKALLESVNSKKKSLVESNIIKSRFDVLIKENVDYTREKNYIKLIDDVVVEINELKENNYNEELINENFFSWLTNFLGNTVGGVPGSLPQMGKEYVVDWFLKVLGLGKGSYLANVVSAAIGNIPFNDYGKLFTDCRFTSEILSKSLVEGFLKQMSDKPTDSFSVSNAIVGLLRNSVTDTLFKDKDGMVGQMSEALNDFICGKLNSVHSKMESAKSEITDKALS
jgi:hypothetical protein